MGILVAGLGVRGKRADLSPLHASPTRLKTLPVTHVGKGWPLRWLNDTGISGGVRVTPFGAGEDVPTPEPALPHTNRRVTGFL